MKETTDIISRTDNANALSVFTNSDSFELAQRAGKMLGQVFSAAIQNDRAG